MANAPTVTDTWNPIEAQRKMYFLTFSKPLTRDRAFISEKDFVAVTQRISAEYFQTFYGAFNMAQKVIARFRVGVTINVVTV